MELHCIGISGEIIVYWELIQPLALLPSQEIGVGVKVLSL